MEGGQAAGRLLNIGCGTGRHDDSLVKLGYTVTGIDQSETMLKIAKDENRALFPRVKYYQADARTFQMDQKFDAVISLFHVMSYMNTNEDLMNALQSVRKVLEKGHVFLFDAWYGPGVLTDKPSVRVKYAENSQLKMIRIAQPVMHDKDNIAEIKYEVTVIDKETHVASIMNETHKMRYFFKPEVDLMLEQSGFKLLDILDARDLCDTGYDTWTCYFAALAV